MPRGTWNEYEDWLFNTFDDWEVVYRQLWSIKLGAVLDNTDTTNPALMGME